MLKALWFYPPLAFARIGLSDEPLESFYWGPNDESPTGTGKTTIIPATTLADAACGTVEARPPRPPEPVLFQDKKGVKPVCPFFELHGSWRDKDGTVSDVPITEEILKRAKKKSSDLTWSVRVANLKPYFMTLDEDTRIDADLQIAGDSYGKNELRGVSPKVAMQPLVPKRQYIPLGIVRLVRPRDADDVFRLRFYPPKGRIYGPTNLKERDFGEALNQKTGKVEKDAYDIPDEFLILNARSSWAKCKPSDVDPRGTPGGQFASDKNGVSLGLVDDVSDGIISCSLAGTPLVARARVVVAPPHYAPDRRHLISIADGLKDRVGREEVHKKNYFSETEQTHRPTVNSQGEVGCQPVIKRQMARLEIHDLLERVIETMGLSNLDAFNDRVDLNDNPLNAIISGLPYKPPLKPGEHGVFQTPPSTDQYPLPLFEMGRQNHRRLSSLEIFENLLRQNPSTIAKKIRPPGDPSPFFDRRMPALMLGSSGQPLHLTGRQYDLLFAWAKILRASIKEGS